MNRKRLLFHKFAEDTTEAGRAPTTALGLSAVAFGDVDPDFSVVILD
jgi:hypothetical protein